MPMILSPAKDGAPVVVDKAVIMIGRHPTCDVVINNSRKVSRKHCCVVQVNDKYFVRDLGSMNGIQVNGKRVKKESPLNLGDLFTVGDVEYRFQLGSAAKKKSAAARKKPPESVAPSAANPASALPPEDVPTKAGMLDSSLSSVVPVISTLDDDMPGLVPLESSDAVPVIAEPRIVKPPIVDDFDEVEVVEEYEDVEIVEVDDDVIEIVDEIEVVEDVVEVVDDGFDIVEVVADDDDVEDVVLLDEDDDFFDGPIDILE